MTRTVPTPAMPLGVKFDPENTLLNNAQVAWEFEQHRNREQRERNAKVLARRMFRTDDLDFSYDVNVGLDTPLFTVEDELIVYLQGERGSTFALIEYCGECGKEWNTRGFGSLADLGRVIVERDADDPFVCRICKLMAQAAGMRK